MPFFIPVHVAKTFASGVDKCRDASGMRAKPECVVLGVAEGVTPSPKPPVRIFLGTEPAQYRAERVFVWSIERLRDPSRVYEIYLMKELAGFNRRRWLTGFTNYRFAIPHYAGGAGRAIWNDVDQAYLADPAELFDTEMADHGFLAICPGGRTDTAVMLMDCARMASVWTLEGAQNEHKNTLIARALAVPGLRGELEPEWHARDEEYVPGRSRLLHWTILHTQPWRPLPQLFVYQRNPVGEVWHDLKRSADRAGYQVFTSARPSAQYKALVTRLRPAGTQADRAPAPERPVERTAPKDLRDLVDKAGAKTVLAYGIGGACGKSAAPERLVFEDPGIAVTNYDPAAPAASGRPSEQFDGVACVEGLDFVPDEDVPWVVDELFGYARRLVYVTVGDRELTKVLADGSRLASRPRELSWWYEHFETAAARHPEVHWALVVGAPKATGQAPVHVREAGRCLDDKPTVWVLAEGGSGNAAQSIALAEALGWPYKVIDSSHRNGELAPPWPDVAVAEGGRAIPTVRWIGKQSHGRTRLVQLGREGAAAAEEFDAVVTPAYYRFAPHPRRIETVTRLTRVNPRQLAEIAERSPSLFGDAPRPRIVLLAGGPTARYRLDTGTARRMGEEVHTFVGAAGGSVHAVTGRRMGPETTGALLAGLGDSAHLRWWRPGPQDEEAYLAYLAAADALIVTAGSESLLADAVASGKPVYIYPLPERQPGPAHWLQERVLARSQARPLNRRGTVRPQQGPEYLCARLIERGVVPPPSDLNALHQTLFRLGVARPFGAPLEAGNDHAKLTEAHEAARRVRELLGLTALST